MIEIIGDLFEQRCDAVCITTNGDISRSGRAVMGRGVALEAKLRFPGIERCLAEKLSSVGNHVSYLCTEEHYKIFSFPVKYHWYEKADLELIECSCDELVGIVDYFEYKKVCLPRPGCENGKLSWAIVAPVLRKYFDDRFVIVEKYGNI